MKRVAVICGGYSSEYEISVLSAGNIAANLPAGYEGYLVFLTREGWSIEVDSEKVPFDPMSFSCETGSGKLNMDLAIIYIHGNPGENGKVQAFLEMQGIPYVNSGPLASELSFDKWYCNAFLSGFNIPVAKSIYLTDIKNTPEPEKIISQLGLPVFVKPCDSGSSFGIAKVKSSDELMPAVENAFNEGRSIIIESFLDGTEVTCGAYRNKNGVQTLPLTEIVTENEFFDYEAKYKGLSDEITPARIDDDMRDKIQELTRRIYNLLGLRSISRVDYMIVGNEPYVIEVNTTPGFSPESIVPKMIKVAGISTQELWAEILEVEYQ